MRTKYFPVAMVMLIGPLFLSLFSAHAEKTAEEYSQSAKTAVGQWNLTQAIADYTKAIEIKPNEADFYYGRGNAYVAQEASDWVKGNGDHDPTRHAGTSSDCAKAINDYTKAIEINPNYAEAYYSRGKVYDKQRNLPQAISDYTKAIEINPNYADAYDARGFAYFTQGDADRANVDYMKGLEARATLKNR